MTQFKYIADLLKKTEMEGSKTCSTPTTPGKTLSRYEGEAMADPTVRIVVQFEHYNILL